MASLARLSTNDNVSQVDNGIVKRKVLDLVSGVIVTFLALSNKSTGHKTHFHMF